MWFHDATELKGTTVVYPYKVFDKLVADSVKDMPAHHPLKGFKYVEWRTYQPNDVFYVYANTYTSPEEDIKDWITGDDTEIWDGIWSVIGWLKLKGLITADNVIIQVSW